MRRARRVNQPKTMLSAPQQSTQNPYCMTVRTATSFHEAVSGRPRLCRLRNQRDTRDKNFGCLPRMMRTWHFLESSQLNLPPRRESTHPNIVIHLAFAAIKLVNRQSFAPNDLATGTTSRPTTPLPPSSTLPSKLPKCATSQTSSLTRPSTSSTYGADSPSAGQIDVDTPPIWTLTSRPLLPTYGRDVRASLPGVVPPR